MGSINRTGLDVAFQIPLAMESLSSAPDEDAGQDNEEGGANHVLIISDCNGRCDFVSSDYAASFAFSHTHPVPFVLFFFVVSIPTRIMSHILLPPYSIVFFVVSGLWSGQLQPRRCSARGCSVQ